MTERTRAVIPVHMAGQPCEMGPPGTSSSSSSTLERLAIDRGEFIERLRHRGIGASVHFIPLHLHPFYRDTLGYRPEDFPNAT